MSTSRSLFATLLATSVAATLALIVALAAAAQAPGGRPRCRATQLAGAIVDVQGAAGSQFGRLILVNASRRTCRMRGFVGAQLVAAGGRRIATTVTRDGADPVRTVRVRSGAAAAFTLRWSDVPSGTRPCRVARYVLVRPPGTTGTVRVFFGAAACRGALEVRALVDPRRV